MFLRSPVLALFALMPLAGAASEPHEVVTRFYHGVRSPGAEGDARAMLGDALGKAVDAQRGYEAACERLTLPGEKGHMLDQSPYLYAPDRPQSVTVGMPRSNGDAVWLTVDMAVSGDRWTDQVLLQKQGPAWKIMDIRWGQGGTLIQRLRQFSAMRCTP